MTHFNTIPDTLQVLIVEDHFATSNGIGLSLSQNKNIEVIAQRDTVEEALLFINKYTVDIVITDLHLATQKTGIELAMKLKQIKPSIKIVVYTFDENPTLINDAIAAGVDGYIFKSDDEEVFLIGIKEVIRGKKFFSSSIPQLLLNLERHTTLPQDEEINPESFNLTKKERQIMVLIAQLNSSATIMKKLNIAPTTLTTHKQNIYRKINLEGDAGITFFAYKYGLVDMSEVGSS